jgi:hypothetical protein
LRRGQRVSKDFNIYHPGEVAQRIAREDLASLCACIGLEDLRELSELNGKIVDGDVKQEKYVDKEGVERSNSKVKKFYETVGIKESVDFQKPEDKFDDEIPF